MRDTAVTVERPTRTSATFWPSLAGVTAFVIISGIDLSLAKADRRLPESVRRRVGHRLRNLPSVHDLCEAFAAGGVASLRTAAQTGEIEPAAVWVCESQVSADNVLELIYGRIAGRGLHDGYDAGTCGPVAYASVWLD